MSDKIRFDPNFTRIGPGSCLDEPEELSKPQAKPQEAPQAEEHEPGETIWAGHCPACGVDLEVIYGEDEGEIGIISGGRGAEGTETPAPVQIAEDLVDFYYEIKALDSQDARIAIKRRDAAQRQAGREEERAICDELNGYAIDDLQVRYAAVVEAARKDHKDFVSFVTDPGIVGDGQEEAMWAEHHRNNPDCPVCKALSDIDEARKE